MLIEATGRTGVERVEQAAMMPPTARIREHPGGRAPRLVAEMLLPMTVTEAQNLSCQMAGENLPHLGTA